MKPFVTPRNLEVGDKLLVELDVDNDYTGEWVEVEVKAIHICHNYRKDGSLAPYIFVRIDHPKLSAINYGLYCEDGHVKRVDNVLS